MYTQAFNIYLRLFPMLALIALLIEGELLSNLVFESCWSCGDLVRVLGFDAVFERDTRDDFGEVIKAA